MTLRLPGLKQTLKQPVLAMLVVIATGPITAPARCLAGGFDRAIEYATPRVVKLYGLAVGPQAGYGSGLLVSPEGHILTAATLLIDAIPIRVVDSKGQRFNAQVVHRDEVLQVALLAIFEFQETRYGDIAKDMPPFPYFDLSIEAELLPGDWVVAAGNAFKVAEGAEPASIAHGVFSTRTRMDARRRVRDFPYRGDVLVVDAITSNPGGPGSALVNLHGEFVGMIGRFVTSNLTNTHFNYAMPRDVLYGFLQIAMDPELRRAHADTSIVSNEDRDLDLGIRLARTGYQQVLPFVERVQRRSPAREAGIRKNDLIVSVNGKSVATVDECEAELQAARADQHLHLVVRRGKKIFSIDIAPNTNQ